MGQSRRRNLSGRQRVTLKRARRERYRPITLFKVSGIRRIGDVLRYLIQSDANKTVAHIHGRRSDAKGRIWRAVCDRARIYNSAFNHTGETRKEYY